MHMSYLIPIPIVLVTAIVYIVSSKYKLKLFMIISKVIMIIGIPFFIVEYLAYLGYDLRTIIKGYF